MFKKRGFRFKSGRQVNEKRIMTISFIIGIAIVMLMMYFL